MICGGIVRRRLAATMSVAVAAMMASLTLSGCSLSLYNASLPGGADLGRHPMTITVHFADVLDLVPQSAVKVNDVSVGRVDSISLDGWFAKVTLQVNASVSLPANAQAELQQTSLLGEKFVQLEAPTDEAPATQRLASGADLPITRTGRNPEVEEVLGALSLVLNGGGLQQIHTIVHELDQALTGHEAEARDLLNQLVTVTKTVDEQKDNITAAITKINTLVTTLNDQKQVLADTLDSLPQALKVLAGETDDLAGPNGLLASLSRLGDTATKVIGASQDDFVSALKELQPVATQLAASGSNLTSSLKILLTFPFPQNVLQSIHGDYVNAHFYLNLDLSTLLSNLTAGGLSTSSIPAAALTPQQQVAAALPLVPGTGD
jgi:phospholipid/cholesterol/gamma-HCH transport system substrate-binding protein